MPRISLTNFFFCVLFLSSSIVGARLRSRSVGVVLCSLCFLAFFLFGRTGRLEPLALLFLWGQSAELQGVDATIPVQLFTEQGVDHTVAGGLHLGAESVGDDDESKDPHMLAYGFEVLDLERREPARGQVE